MHVVWLQATGSVASIQFELSCLQSSAGEESREVLAFRELQAGVTAQFIEEALMPYFGELMMFVKECELAAERSGLDAYKHQERKSPSHFRFLRCSTHVLL